MVYESTNGHTYSACVIPGGSLYMIYRNDTLMGQTHGKEKLEKLSIKINNDLVKEIPTDFFIPLFGLSPKLGPLSEWGLEIEKNAIKVDTFDYQTNIPGIFAIGDINTYKGKLKLILCGFHEATLMCQSAYKILNPGKNLILKYTTVSGVQGFDGSKKEAEKAVVKSINS